MWNNFVTCVVSRGETAVVPTPREKNVRTV